MDGENTSKEGTTANAGTNTGESGERTFTQGELDAIIGERLKREREKYADYEDLKDKASKYEQSVENNKTELQKATEAIEKLKNQINGYTKAESVRRIREKISEETKVPASLLSGEDEETCKKQAEAILAFAKPREYPGAKRNTNQQSTSQRDTNQQMDDSLREFAHQIFSKGE